jgi:glycosyltransferase involved in cell wall biosynthesis
MLSIIIPTYNEEKSIGETLGRLTRDLDIPNKKYEIIVTDDYSTDNTVEIARRYPIIILEHKSKHATIAANRNAGAKASHGEILIFMDSDCIIENIDKSLAQAASLFILSDKYEYSTEKNIEKKLVGLTGAIGVVKELETWSDKIVYSIFNTVHKIKNNILHIGEASGKFQMIHRDAFLYLNGFREDLVTREDGDMFNRLSKIGRTYYDPNILIRHTGRRAHKLGWPKLLGIWVIETIWFTIFDKSLSKVWKDVR